MASTSCFGYANRFAREEMLRNPEAYERHRLERRKWLEEDAAKHGYELPPYRPNEL